MSQLMLPPVAGWDDWRPVFTDASLWRPVVERVWASDPALRAATNINIPARVEAGFPGTCAVFLVDGAAVIKFFPPMVARDFDRERPAYGLIGGLSPHLPRLLAAGVFHDRIAWPYLVLSLLPGEAWREARAGMNCAEQLGTLRELGRIMRLTHKLPLPNERNWPATSDWPTFVASRRPRLAAELREHTSLPGHLIGKIASLVKETDWQTARPCLLHADLTEDHLLVNRQDGRWVLSGLIDWADAEVGDPYYEWVALWFSICRRDARLFRGFLSGYDSALRLDDIQASRLLAFTVLHRFGANVLNETLTEAGQRGMDSIATLSANLFPGLSS
jgi:hygromycin-B 7''-O-kinase